MCRGGRRGARGEVAPCRATSRVVVFSSAPSPRRGSDRWHSSTGSLACRVPRHTITDAHHHFYPPDFIQAWLKSPPKGEPPMPPFVQAVDTGAQPGTDGRN